MATACKAPDKKRRTFIAKPRPDLNIDAVRDGIEKRYENTLRYLGR